MAITTSTATFSANGDGSFAVQIGAYSFNVWPQELKQQMRKFDVVQTFFGQAIQALSSAGIDPETATLQQIKQALQNVQFVVSL
jgi:siderophore synthetase component